MGQKYFGENGDELGDCIRAVLNGDFSDVAGSEGGGGETPATHDFFCVRASGFDSVTASALAEIGADPTLTSAQLSAIGSAIGNALAANTETQAVLDDEYTCPVVPPSSGRDNAALRLAIKELTEEWLKVRFWKQH